MQRFKVTKGWKLILLELGVEPRAVLKRAGLSPLLFQADEASVDAEGYFALIEAVIAEADNPDLPILLAQTAGIETFDPVLFAALCSPDFNTAHYLKKTDLPGAEISFLLGYDAPTSFYRAFHQWTGTIPEALRAS